MPVIALTKASQVSSATAGFPTAPIAAGSLVGSYLVARTTRQRPLGGIALAAGGAWCARQWHRRAGPAISAGLVGIYLGGFGASHPLAKKIGAWPSVLTVAGLSGVAAWTLADRRR